MRRLYILTAALFLLLALTLAGRVSSRAFAAESHAVLSNDPVTATATPSVQVDASVTPVVSSAITATTDGIVSTAKRYLGYPYAYIGDDPTNGFSCIGFAHFVFAANGVYVPEELGAAYASAPQVSRDALQPGDLVFFKDTAWKGISHVSIYMGDDRIIGADSLQTGVEVVALSDPYWQKHYLGATRPLQDPSGTPPNLSATPVPSGPPLAPPGPPNLVIAAGSHMSVRQTSSIYSGPGAGYTAIDTVLGGTLLVAIQTQGQWVNVSYNDGTQYGWIDGGNLSSGGTSVTLAADTILVPRARVIRLSVPHRARLSTVRRASPLTRRRGDRLVITAHVLLVRVRPATHAPVLRRVFAGDRVTLVAAGPEWDLVEVRGRVGWINAHWVR